MKDKEIIKGLECCVIGYECPKDCPYMGKGLCVDKIRKDALDLINHQKAEIEALTEFTKKSQQCIKEKNEVIDSQKAEIERLEIKIEGVQEANAILREHIRKAVKEFEERAIKNICEKVYAPTPVQSCIVEKCNQVIIEIAKEMVGEG